MAAGEAERDTQSAGSASESTTVLPETAAQLVQLEELQRSLAQAQEQARNHWDQYLRAVAELENVRKRAQRDADSASRAGLEKFAIELLPVRDSLELAVVNAPRSDAHGLAAGQEATLKLLSRAFEKIGIEEIDPLGQRFDPTQHEAMMVQPSASAAPDSVLQVVQRGYSLNGRLLRPARVIVATAAAART